MAALKYLWTNAKVSQSPPLRVTGLDQGMTTRGALKWFTLLLFINKSNLLLQWTHLNARHFETFPFSTEKFSFISSYWVKKCPKVLGFGFEKDLNSKSIIFNVNFVTWLEKQIKSAPRSSQEESSIMRS